MPYHALPGALVHVSRNSSSSLVSNAGARKLIMAGHQRTGYQSQGVRYVISKCIHLILAQIPPLERGIFVMNRTLKDGLRTEPTLVLTCGTKPMLMLNSTEFEAFVERLPWIKEQMNEFYKLI